MTYLGDRHTDPALKGKTCTAVRNDEAKAAAQEHYTCKVLELFKIQTQP